VSTPHVKTLAVWLAESIAARANCLQSNNAEWLDRHTARIDALAQFLPSGSGIDSGTSVDLDRSHADRLVLVTSFHHMNSVGYYDGWTDHAVYVTPTFTGISVDVRGRNRNEIKDYLVDVFQHALSQSVEVLADDSVRIIQS